MDRDFIKKIDNYIEKNHMIQKGDRVVAGVSGGADSVCLFKILTHLQTVWRETRPFSLAVVHVEHGLRGREAMEDAAWVQELCAADDVPFFLFHEDVAGYAADNRLSVEEAGRILRYRAFESACERWRGTKIAVAHHKNDLAETMLFHLFRGSGLQGLRGIEPVQGRIIRPLLETSRQEVEVFLTEKHISYRTDSTNFDNIYSRNKIRNVIMPAAEEINERVADNMAETAVMAAEAERYLRAQALAAQETCAVRQAGRTVISAGKFSKYDIILRKYIIYHAIEELSGSRRDVSGRHIAMVIDLFRKGVGKRISLPYGLTAVREYEAVVLTMEGEGDLPADIAWRLQVQAPGSMELPDGRRISFSVEMREKDQIIPEKMYTKWFDYDTIKNGLCLRYRKQGDYLCVNDSLQSKSLKAYFIHEKVPQTMRSSIPLLAEENHILWVIGHRISAKYKVTEATGRILKVQISGGTKG